MISHTGAALIIGVWRYRDPLWGDLPSIEDNIDTLAQGLAPHFQTVRTVKNPPTDPLRSELRNFIVGSSYRGVKRLFVYYGGHGFTDFNQSSRTNDGYITGTDTPAYDPNNPVAVSEALSFQEIDSMNRESRAVQVLMAFDSCFSGSIFMTRMTNLTPRREDAERARILLNLPSRFFITAGGPNDEVPANSPFAALILRGLSGEADFYGIGLVTAEDLGIYIKRNMGIYSGRPMNPQSGPIRDVNLSRGQFIFLTAQSAADIALRAAPPTNDAPIIRSFIIFFDWNTSTLTNKAKERIQEAAVNFMRSSYTTLEVNGYTDTATASQFSKQYAVDLTKKQAQAVAAELIRNGVPRSAVVVRGFGATHLLVPTAAGVREPQNRRIEIILQSSQSVAADSAALVDVKLAGDWHASLDSGVSINMKISPNGAWSSETLQQNNVLRQMKGIYTQTPSGNGMGTIVFTPIQVSSKNSAPVQTETDQYELSNNGQQLKLTSAGDTMVFKKR
jgi:outer membrane protein OmpA-like peptidoglycan-associated protein